MDGYTDYFDVESHAQNEGSMTILDALCTSGMIERDDIITGLLLEYSDVDFSQNIRKMLE